MQRSLSRPQTRRYRTVYMLYPGGEGIAPKGGNLEWQGAGGLRAKYLTVLDGGLQYF